MRLHLHIVVVDHELVRRVPLFERSRVVVVTVSWRVLMVDLLLLLLLLLLLDELD